MKSTLKCIHCTALHTTVCALHTVLHGDQGFRILGGNAENAGEPAPQYSAGAAQGEKYASYALTLSVLASTAVGVLMTLTGGIVALPLIGIVLYQAAWLVITLFFPLMQR